MNTRLCLVSITFAVTMLSPAAGRADYQRIAGYPIDLRGSGLVSAYIGDFDGDERLEIVGAQGLSVAIYDLLTGQPEFIDQYVGPAINFSVEDFDFDGRPEIVVSFEGEGTALYDFVGASAVPADERPMRDQASSRLERAHPNPLNPATTIPYVLAAPGLVELRLYDVQGRLVRRLTGGRQPAGAHEIVWDGRDETGSQLASGQYFATLTVNGKVVDTSRAVILK